MKARKIIFLLVTLFFVVNNIKLVNAQSDYKIAEQDSLALVAFYHATDGPNWISNQDGFSSADLSSEWQEVYTGGYNKWLNGPVKDWFGVTVEKQTNPQTNQPVYRVVKLWPVIGRRTDGQNRLKGYIPKEVGLLTALKEFMVNGNNGLKDTEIPDDLYQKTLEAIDVEAAYFDGDVSDAYRNCINIKKNNFRYNSFDYFPSIDFLDQEALDQLQSSFFLYSTEIPLSNFERMIDHFYSASDIPKRYGIQMRDVTNVGDEIEIVAPLGSAVDLECVFAGNKEEFITYQWLKNGLLKFGKTKRTYSITSVKQSDYGAYTIKITNEYVRAYDGNSNWGEVVTKAIHLVAEPVAPVIQWAKTTYNGKEIHLRFSKPMPEAISGLSGFSVSAGGKNINVVSAETKGRLRKDVFLKLADFVDMNNEVAISYSGNGVSDKNGGVLAGFSDLGVENLVRTAPAFVSAQTTKDGSGIEVLFDNFIDPASINIAEFSVVGKNNYTIASGHLMSGDIDDNISKRILLTLNQSITDSLEVIKVSYNKGSLSGKYGAVAESFQNEDVKNITTLKVTPVTLYFEDGSNELQNVFVTGSWGLNAVQMFDNGSNGDEVADDHIWTAQFNLVDDNYTWNVISREVISTYDTTSVTDPLTGVITQTIVPISENVDEVLSDNSTLTFQVGNNQVQGTTSFGYMNLSVTFNLTVNNTSDEIYLMGIEDDWLNGLLLSKNGDNSYTITVSGLGIGDVLTYNFRDGDNWENVTTESRIYTVKDGENIINHVFGVFTNTNQIKTNNINVFPNPTTGLVFFSSINTIKSIKIYSMSGHLVDHVMVNKDDARMNIEHLKSGVYFLHLIGDNLNTTQKLIKTN